MYENPGSCSLTDDLLNACCVKRGTRDCRCEGGPWEDTKMGGRQVKCPFSLRCLMIKADGRAVCTVGFLTKGTWCLGQEFLKLAARWNHPRILKKKKAPQFLPPGFWINDLDGAQVQSFSKASQINSHQSDNRQCYS